MVDEINWQHLRNVPHNPSFVFRTNWLVNWPLYSEMWQRYNIFIFSPAGQLNHSPWFNFEVSVFLELSGKRKTSLKFIFELLSVTQSEGCKWAAAKPKLLSTWWNEFFELNLQNLNIKRAIKTEMFNCTPKSNFWLRHWLLLHINCVCRAGLTIR